MDDILITGAIVFLLVGFGATMFSLGAKKVPLGALNFISTLGALALLTAVLYRRGMAQGSCPINSLFNVLLFTGWSILLISLIVGPAYQISLLGAFTAPLVFFVLLCAHIVPAGIPALGSASRNPWVEFHAAGTLVSYGAFALAAIAGTMYLLQDRQLKRRKAGALMYNLSPITALATANARLIHLGFWLLTTGFAAGFISGMQISGLKFLVSVLIWAAYAAILVLRWAKRLSPRRTAAASIAVFAAALVLLPAIQNLSSTK